jgi:IclR family acetate operon transcriptional repressor
MKPVGRTSRERPQGQVQVIARAAAILRALEDEAAGLSLGQIAQRVNLARSTVQRIVAALEADDPTSRRFGAH